jgi:hypothetical protein
VSIPKFDVNYPLTVERRIDWTTPIDPVVTDGSSAFRGRIYSLKAGSKQDAFRGRVYGSRPDAADASPRLYLPRAVLWYKPGALAVDIAAGERVSDGLDVYEALTPGVGKRAGTTVLIVEAECVSINGLYPILADLTELGSAAVVAQVPIALWHQSDNNTTRGEFSGYAAETPVEHFDKLRVSNREIRVAGRVFHIDQTVLHHDQPHVSMTLREKVRS